MQPEWHFFEPFLLNIHAQNRSAERFGQLIIKKVRAMCLSANLPNKLWREIVSTSTYLYTPTQRASNYWKSLYESFHSYVSDKEELSVPQKLLLHHFGAFIYRAYVPIKSKKNPKYRQKSRKLDAKAHISFLVGYESTNIYRIWVPNKKRVALVRDVIFNEDKV